MRFGSVCSGIEAASVAFEPLGWQAAWFSEIEPFPSAVLAHHYPGVPNLGDMTKIAQRIASGDVEAPDMLCGGTPCQAFSVAGLRQSLSDERGNLSLVFCELADAIDHSRIQRGDEPCVVFWENVPGVLNTKDNAFGCFLGALAGESDALVPPGGKWANAGAVLGPKRTIAWRVLDAQYFGLAQRRKRVFVVASAREGFDPATVLFEWDGVRRDTAPSREAGKDAAAGTLRSTDGGCDVDHVRAGHVVGPLTAACGPNGHGGSGLATDKGAEAGHIVAFGGNRTSGSIDITPALLAQPGSGWKGDFESETFLVQENAHTLRDEGVDASEEGTGRGTPLVPMAFQPGNLARGCGSAPSTEVFPTLKADHGRGQSDQDPHVMVPVAFDTTQVPSPTNRSNPQPGDPCHPLAAGAHPPAIAFDCKASGMAGFGVGDIASTMRAMGPAGSHSNGGGQLAVAYPIQECNVSRAKLKGTGTGLGQAGDPMFTLQAAQPHGVATAMQVRRLTPVECERLQGFPDDYTLIPWRKKPAEECPDGPRYKALGNSWAVPCVRWIGRRIQAHLGGDVRPALRMHPTLIPKFHAFLRRIQEGIAA